MGETKVGTTKRIRNCLVPHSRGLTGNVILDGSLGKLCLILSQAGFQFAVKLFLEFIDRNGMSKQKTKILEMIDDE